MYYQLVLILAVLPPILLFSLARLEGKTGMGPSPMRVFGWTLLLGFTLKSLYLSYAVRTGAPFISDWLSFDIIDTGQVAILASIFCVMAGYVTTLVLLRKTAWSYGSVRPPKFDIRLVYWSFFAISLGLMVIFFYKMGFLTQLARLQFVAAKRFISEESGVSSSLGFLTLGGDFLVIMCIARLVSLPKVRLFDPHVVALGFICLSYMLSSRRNGVLVFVILYLIVASFLRFRRTTKDVLPRSSGLAILKIGKLKRWGLLGLLLLALTFVGQIRKGRGEASVSDLNVATAIGTTIEHALEGAYFLDPAKTAAIVSEIDRRDSFLLGGSFYNVLFVPIPRAIWPEKPNIRIGPYVGQEILRFNNKSGAPPGGVAELYMNFGWLGTMFGSFVIGAITGLSWHRAHNTVDTLHGGLRYGIVMLCMILFLIGDFSVTVLFYAKYRIAAAITLRYYAARGRVSEQTAPIADRPLSSGGLPVS